MCIRIRASFDRGTRIGSSRGPRRGPTRLRALYGIGEKLGAQEGIADTHPRQRVAVVGGIADQGPSAAETAAVEVRQLRCASEGGRLAGAVQTARQAGCSRDDVAV